MFDVDQFVAGKEYRAQRLRSEARWLTFGGIVTLYIAVPCFVVGGLVRAGLEHDPRMHTRPMLFEIAGFLSRLAAAIYQVVEANIGIPWDILPAISPHPRFENPPPLVSWFGWLRVPTTLNYCFDLLVPVEMPWKRAPNCATGPRFVRFTP